MKISVVMASFNSAETIAASIESFLDQDYSDKELLVIDGASTDSTMKIVESFQSPLIKWTSERDAGIYDGINKGIRAASGDIIGVLHSNDLFSSKSTLSDIWAAFEGPRFDVVYADAAFFRSLTDRRITRRYRSKHFSRERIAWGWMPAHTTLFARRAIFEEFGYYKTKYRIAADFEFVARIFKGNDISAHYVPEIWVHMSSGGASTGGLKSKILLNREVIRACRENGIETNYAMILSKYPLKLLEYIAK